MSAGVTSVGMFTVLLIAPDRNGWAAAIIGTWARQLMLRTPLAGLKAQSNTARCSSAQGRGPFDRVVLIDVLADRLDLRLVVAELLQGQRHRAG